MFPKSKPQILSVLLLLFRVFEYAFRADFAIMLTTLTITFAKKGFGTIFSPPQVYLFCSFFFFFQSLQKIQYLNVSLLKRYIFPPKIPYKIQWSAPQFFKNPVPAEAFIINFHFWQTSISPNEQTSPTDNNNSLFFNYFGADFPIESNYCGHNTQHCLCWSWIIEHNVNNWLQDWKRLNWACGHRHLVQFRI